MEAMSLKVPDELEQTPDVPPAAMPLGADLPARWPAAATLAAWVIVLGGAGLRVIRYAAARSLWLDEASLAMNFVRRSYAGLLRTLDHEQGAPLGFVLATKAATNVLGINEYGLRLVPLLAGVLALPVMLALLRKSVRWEAGLIALALFALAESGLYYSSEVKQYSMDALATTLILYVGVSALREGYTQRNLVALLAVGLAGPWLSFPSLFSLAAVGLTLAGRSVSARRWGEVRSLAFIGAGWLAMFVLLYFVSMRDIARNPFFKQFWRNSFLPFPPQGIGDLRMYLTMFFRAFPDALGVSFHPDHEMTEIGALVGVFFLVAIVILALRRDWKLGLLFIPVLLCIVASMLKLYPFSNRLLVFAAPIFVFGMAFTFAWIMDLCRTRRDRAVAWSLLIGCLIVPATVSAAHLWPAPPRQETRDAMATIARKKQSGDVVYVNRLTREPFDFYAPRFGLSGMRIDPPGDDRDIDKDPAKMTPMITEISRHERVWLLMTAVHPNTRTDQYVNQALLPRGKKLLDQSGPGYRLMLWDFRGAGAVNGAATKQSPPPTTTKAGDGVGS